MWMVYKKILKTFKTCLVDVNMGVIYSFVNLEYVYIVYFLAKYSLLFIIPLIYREYMEAWLAFHSI